MDKISKKEHIFTRVKKSIYTGSINPQNENDRIRLAVRNLILHLHPSTVYESTIKFNHTFGLGGMAALLFILQIFTGLLLRFVYEPFPGRAFDSIIYLQSEVLFGQLIRNIHHWSGILFIIVTFLHLLRVYFTGAYHAPRQFNWILGLALLVIVIFSNFTGYLLPWDQLAYWAITVSTNMLEYIPLIGSSIRELILGGNEVNSSTLLLFYNFHTGIFPILIITIMAFHFWRVRKAGGVVIPGGNDNDSKSVTTIPHLVSKEFVAALVLIAFILLLAVFFDAPLQEKANPNFSPNPSKAPWYFMGVQEMVLHFHPLFAAIIIPLILITLLVSIPYLNYDSNKSGVLFYSEKGKQIGLFAVIISTIITIAGIILDEYIFNISGWLGNVPLLISNGLLPFLIWSGIVFGFYKYVIRKYSADKNEAVQAVFIFLLASFLLLTITGEFFRGPGMALGF